jgi:hypothetical protein
MTDNDCGTTMPRCPLAAAQIDSSLDDSSRTRPWPVCRSGVDDCCVLRAVEEQEEWQRRRAGQLLDVLLHTAQGERDVSGR